MSEPDIVRAPSAITTGGGGFEFENRVGAWVASALVAGTSPVGQLGPPRVIGFQEKALGQVLDDIAVTAADGVTRWLASIKTYDLLTASKLNEEFVGEAWLQLLSDGFDLGRDFVGFVSGTAAEGNWQSLLQLIEEARTNPPDRLAARIAVPEHFDETARTLWESARCPEPLQSRLPVPADVAPGVLLSRLTPLRLDLLRPDGQARQQARTWCEAALAPGQPARADDLWDALFGLVARARPRAGTIDWGLIVRELGARFAFSQRPEAGPDWAILDRHTRERVEGVRDTLAGGLSLPRAEATAALAEAVDDPFVYLGGESGSGKTALAKSWLMGGQGDKLWLSATDLAGGLGGFAAAHNLRLGLDEVLALGRAPVRVIVDGLDRLSATRSAAPAVAALARQAAASDGALQLVVTAQSFSLDRVIRAVLSANGPAHRTATISELDDEDVRLALAQRPQMGRLAIDGRLRGVLRRPKLLEVLADAIDTTSDEQLQAAADEAAVADLWWDHLALGGHRRAQRAELLIGLASEQGDSLTDAIPAGQLGTLGQYAAVADPLRADAVLAPDERSYAFAHDLFGDWSRLRALGGWDAGGEQAIKAKAALPSWHRAIRLFALRSLRNDRVQWAEQQSSLRNDTADIAADLFLDAPLVAHDAEDQLQALWPTLVDQERPLLGRMLTRFLPLASVPDPMAALFASDERPELLTYFEATWRVPIWGLWPPVITVIAAHADEALNTAPLQVAEIADRWLRARYPHLPARAEAAQIGLAIGRYAEASLEEGRYFDRAEKTKLWRAFLAAGRELPAEISESAVEVFANDEEPLEEEDLQ
jgi:hypothetical protein